jgi:hypothetical protein
METRMTIKFSDITGGGIPYGNNAGRPANPGIGKLYSNGEEKRLELYTSTGWQNIVSETPGVVSLSGNYLESSGSGTLEITGTNFTTGAIASVIGTNGVEINATSTTVNSIVSVTAVFSGLSNENEPYDVKVTNTSNLFGLLPDALYVNASPVWQTASGSLGTFNEQVSVSVSATATDSDSIISYSLASGSSLPSGISLNSATGLISGTLPGISSDTTYTFTINASDGFNTIPRAFSIVSNYIIEWNTASGSLGSLSYTQYFSGVSSQLSASSPVGNTTYSVYSGSLPPGLSISSSGLISGTPTPPSVDTLYSFVIRATNGVRSADRSFSYFIKAPVLSTFSTVGNTSWIAPSGVTSIELLVVAGGGGSGNDVGGGGGGGGLCYSASYPVTPGSTYNITVGNGGANSTGSAIKGSNGGDSAFGSVLARGGGGGGSYPGNGAGLSGGSGGGGGDQNYSGGSSTQTSGPNYTGYGNAGGSSWTSTWASGSGGGAGGAGNNGAGVVVAGGLPREFSISGSPVKYSGGGYGNTDGGAVYTTGYNESNVLVGYYGFGANGTGSPNTSPTPGNPGVVIVKH